MSVPHDDTHHARSFSGHSLSILVLADTSADRDDVDERETLIGPLI